LEFIQTWARGLVALVILVGLVELLMPQDALKPYVRMVLGLLVVIALIRPIIHELPGLRSADFSLEDVSEGDLDGVITLGEQIRERGNAVAAKLATSMDELESRVLGEVPEVESIRIVQNNRGVLTVWVKSSVYGDIRDKVLNVLEYYGWRKEIVEVIRDGA
jgi:stage III sporulation protein AF